jgi:hypothetical protein
MATFIITAKDAAVLGRALEREAEYLNDQDRELARIVGHKLVASTGSVIIETDIVGTEIFEQPFTGKTVTIEEAG